MSSGAAGPIHGRTTSRSGYRYQFYTKHHARQKSPEAQWFPELTREQEFEVFDRADQLELTDERGNLYGMRPRKADGRFPHLGTRGEQVAKFPFARDNAPWHGYPLWPNETPRAPSVPDVALAKLVGLGLLSASEQRRLRKGKSV